MATCNETIHQDANLLFSIPKGVADITYGPNEGLLFTLRSLFYLVLPSEMSTKPNYVHRAGNYFFAAILIEGILLTLSGRGRIRFNDMFGSLSASIFHAQYPAKRIAHALGYIPYVYIYENYRLVDPPSDLYNPWLWITGMLATDFCYYWLHRLSHEVNFLWAAHQVHHSSQDYNLSTALRQSFLQAPLTQMIWLPAALFLPPQMFLVHRSLNLIVQFWIHTEVIRDLGPLEYVICTPSSHRVHHGRNPYCIDKNYGGQFIFWDILFGTFAREGEKVSYGLVSQVNSFDPIYIQFGYMKNILHKAWASKTLSDTFRSLFYGPGWHPGTGRLGDINEIPEVDPNNDKLHNSDVIVP